MGITYSIFLVCQGEKIEYSELSDEKKRDVAKYLRKTPLETLGQVIEIKSA